MSIHASALARSGGTPPLEGAAVQGRVGLRRGLGVLFRGPLPRIGMVILGVLAVCAVLPTNVLPHDPFSGDVSLRHLPPVFLPGAQARYLLGTDALGRDLLSRAMYAGRFSLSIALAATCVSVISGTLLGMVSGYFGGMLDTCIMRLADVQLAFPVILLTLAVVAVLGPSVPNLILVMGLSGWAQTARIVRGSTLAVRVREYVQAARVLGADPRRVLRSHILPNVLSPLVVMATFEIARFLLLEASLSFLGLGIQPPTPSWGNMIADGRNYLFNAWWVSALPGVLIVLAVLAFNYIGDGIRDALDPDLI
jgi:peptide/nickel transport system permease protein